MQLRPYQNKAVADLSKGFATFKRQIYQAATGSGKTVVFSEIVRRAAERGTPTLICTNRVELFSQSLKAISNSTKGVQLINPENKYPSSDALVSIAMVETLKRRIAKGFVINPKLIIIDECHIASFNSIIESFPNANILGCSATPLGKHIYRYYNNIICAPQISELIKDDFLCDYKAYEMRDNLDDLQKDSTGEYTESSLYKHYNKQERYAGVIKEYITRINGLKTIVFCVNVDHAINTCASFKAAGISCEYVIGDMPKEQRNAIFKAFSDGLITVLVNCMIAVFGYDCPSIQAVILDFATTSLPKFLQTIGRGSRIYRNKERFVVLDFGLNHSKHGMWSEDRTWTLAPPKKRKQKEQPAPIKKCPKCEAIISARALKCDFCEYEFPQDKEQLKDGVMVEIKPKVPVNLVGKKVSDLSIDELIELQKSKTYKSSFVWRVIRSKGEFEIQNYASKIGYTKGWVQHQKEKIKDSNFNNYILK